MSNELLALKAETQKLKSFFLEKAEISSIKLSPTEFSERETIFSRIIYDETKDYRRITVVLIDEPPRKKYKSDSPYFCAFIKKTGLNYEIELLYVSVMAGQAYCDQLWNIYWKWFHMNCSESDMKDYLFEINS